MAGLSKDDCPYSDEEFAAYKEGWLAAWQWSIDILAKMMRETKDLTDE
jgi:ribosome modulation factor